MTFKVYIKKICKCIVNKIIVIYFCNRKYKSVYFYYNRKFPEWDVPGVSSEVKLVEAKRELDEAEMRLELKRVEAAESRKDLDEQWKDLEEKEELLRQSFIKFNKVSKINNYAFLTFIYDTSNMFSS